MKISLYNEPHEGAIGGAEQCVAALAAGLAETHCVEIVHHRADMTGASLAAFAGVDLNGVGMRFVPFTPSPPLSRNAVQVWRTQKSWNAELSAFCDVFIVFGHGMPPFCHARRGVLVVLFPTDDRVTARARRGRGLRGRVEQTVSDALWRERIAGYQQRVAISEYVRGWTNRFWEMDCAVLPPPVDTDFAVDADAKEPLILSIGRFTGVGVRKRQPEMMQAYAEIRIQFPETDGWRYESVGGLGDRPADRETFAATVRAAEGCPAEVRPNLSRADLKDCLRRASVFWHAAGYGAGADRPQDVEHFGITTVEAMAAGCVPVVINRGGQPEIVEHGKSGFVWNTWAELQSYTARLAGDPGLRAQMSEAARTRARYFSRARCVERFACLLQEM